MQKPAKAMWNERYSEQGYAYGTEPNDFLISVAGRIPGPRVLCLAEGEGRNAVWLAEQGFDVTAVDSSDAGLAKAQQLAQSRNVTIHTQVADLAEFEIQPGQWDAIVAVYCHLPPPLRTAVHARAVAGLKPDGVFILEAFTPAQIGRGTGGPGMPVMMMTLDGLNQELTGLTFEHGQELVRDVTEGRFHTGEAAVVQVLGIKS